jgi:spermidine/putrescine transport system substrate-binding protein
MRFRLLLVAALLLSAIRLRAEDTLNLFIWSEYLPGEVAREFENRFKCKLVIDLYEDAEAMLAKIQNGGSSSYDVAVPPDYIVPVLVREKLIAPLRQKNIPNLKNLDEKFLNPPFDPGNRYSAAYQWGTLGIFARKVAGQELEESWGLFFEPAEQPGSVVLMDSMRDLIGAALKYQGNSFNSVDAKQLREARELLISAKERSAGFTTAVGGRTKVLEKSARAAIVYSSDAIRGMREDPDTYFFIPKEGSQIYLDNMVVMSQAPHRDLAEKFINFVLEPEISARISNGMASGSPNAAAKKFIDPELVNNPGVYPSEEMMRKLEYLKDLGKNTRLYDQLWTSIKSR